MHPHLVWSAPTIGPAKVGVRLEGDAADGDGLAAMFSGARTHGASLRYSAVGRKPEYIVVGPVPSARRAAS